MKNSKKGFTLVEILLYIAILSTMILLILGFLTMAMNLKVKNETITEVDYQGAYIMSLILNRVKNAENISFPEKGSSSDELIFNSGESEIIINAIGGVVYIKEGENDMININNNYVSISNLSFNNLGSEETSDSIQIIFEIERVNETGRMEYHFQRSFRGAASLPNFNQ